MQQTIRARESFDTAQEYTLSAKESSPPLFVVRLPDLDLRQSKSCV